MTRTKSDETGIAAAVGTLIDALACCVIERLQIDWDTLVPIAKEPLAKLRLEYGAVLRLAQEGTLKTVWIGRRRYTRNSWLTALADTLPAATPSSTGRDDALETAVRRAAERVVRKEARARAASRRQQ